jgi:hypothetical protein
MAGRLHPATTANAPDLHRGWLSWITKEDDMTSTLNPACPLCGLRYASRPLLELHIREDHRSRGRRDPGGTRVRPARAGSPADGPGPASRPAPARHPAIRAVRRISDRLLRAWRGRYPLAARTEAPPDAAERADRAA